MGMCGLGRIHKSASPSPCTLESGHDGTVQLEKSSHSFVNVPAIREEAHQPAVIPLESILTKQL